MSGMDLGGGAGAGGAVNGLQQLLAQRYQRQQFAEAQRQALVRETQNQQLLDQNADLKRLQIQAMQQARQDAADQRDAGALDAQANLLPPGSPVSDADAQRFQRHGLGSLITQRPALPAMPEGFVGPMPAGQTTDAMPSAYIFTGTQKQADVTSEEQRKRDADANRMADLTDKVNQAWERLRLQGDNVQARSELAQRAAELAQAKLELERQRTTDAVTKTPQPIFFQDANGATHAAIFDRGKFSEIPLPSGYTPTKAVAPGIFDKLRGLFSSGPSSPETDYTNPNWGK